MDLRDCMQDGTALKPQDLPNRVVMTSHGHRPFPVPLTLSQAMFSSFLKTVVSTLLMSIRRVVYLMRLPFKLNSHKFRSCSCFTSSMLAIC